MEEQQKRKVVKTASIPLIKEELAILERIKNLKASRTTLTLIATVFTCLMRTKSFKSA